MPLLVINEWMVNLVINKRSHTRQHKPKTIHNQTTEERDVVQADCMQSSRRRIDWIEIVRCAAAEIPRIVNLTWHAIGQYVGQHNSPDCSRRNSPLPLPYMGYH